MPSARRNLAGRGRAELGAAGKAHNGAPASSPATSVAAECSSLRESRQVNGSR